jgi:predicted RecB family nuclease
LKKRDENNLTEIPGIGKSIANDFRRIGITKVSDLKKKNPEELYLQICAEQGCQVDRCVLYVCRSSVYFAETKNPDPEKLKWWNWKDVNKI